MSRSHITTHVLDVMHGAPAAGIAVALVARTGSDEAIAQATTDSDGRIHQLGPSELSVGTYRLVFDTGAYFVARSQATFFPEIVLTVSLTDTRQHYHVPLLLSPFSYTTYRGS